MPRKDSDDEYEYKGIRKTRATLNPSVLDSPLRRSSRIKQPSNQDDSSPESIGEGSITGSVRNTRRRTTALDTGLPEATKKLRTRRNSAASDISELTETESLPDGPARRVTRRSIAGPVAPDTPTKINARTRRAVRAGSESKSTPPVGRITRRTRASSMEPEVVEESKIRELNTPIKSKRRASVFPTEPDVAEESEDLKVTNVHVVLQKTVVEVNEDNETENINPSSQSPVRNKSNSEQRKSSQIDIEEKMEIDESPVKDSDVVVIERSAQESTESESDYSRVPEKLEDSVCIVDSSITENASDENSIRQQPVSSSKETSIVIGSPFNKSIDKQDKSPGNKENEVLNVSLGSIERNLKIANTDVRLLTRKSLNSSIVKKPEKRHNISADFVSCNESPSSQPGSPVIASKIDKSFEGSVNNLSTIQSKKEYCVEDCVVILEPMEIDRRSDDFIVETESKKSTTIPNSDGNNAESKDVESPENPTVDLSTVKDEELPEINSSQTHVAIVDDEIDVDIEEKSVEDINLNVSNESNEIKISNVVSIVAEENQKETEQSIEKTNEEINEKKDEKEVEAKDEEKIECVVEKEAENEIAEEIPQSQAPQSETDVSAIVSSSTISTIENISVEKTNNSTIAVSSSVTIEIIEKPGETVDELLRDTPKNEKSSIVTESPAHGTNDEKAEKATNVTDSQTKDESAEGKVAVPLVSSDSAEAHENQLQKEEANKKKSESLEKGEEMESGSDSENIDEPLFQDIPAEDWKKSTSDEQKNVEFETNSVHSSSTERIESECELVLVDKDAWLAAEKERREKEQMDFDYDSDDTVINKCGILRKKSDQKNQDDNSSSRVTQEETPMDVTSDVEDEDEVSSDVVNKSPLKKRQSINSPLKSDGNASLKNKNNLKTPQNSPASLNVSRRKSADKKKSVDDESNDSTANASFNKSLKNRNSNGNGPRGSRVNDESSGSEEDADSSKIKTPKPREDVNKKRLDVSVKKTNDGKTPEASKAKSNTATPEKRKSLNKSVSNAESRPIEGNSDDNSSSQDVIGSVFTQSEGQDIRNFGKFKTKLTPMKKDKLKLSENKTSDNSSDSDMDSQDDVEIDEGNKSAKTNSHETSKTQKKLRKSGGSISHRDSVTDDDNNSEEDEEILNKSSKTGSCKKVKVNKTDVNKSSINLTVGDEDDSQEDPEMDQRKLNRSLKSASAKKSVIHQNYTKLSHTNSNSDADENDSDVNVEKMINSLKSLSSKKSGREQNYSMMAQINSDSDNPKDEETTSSDDDADISRKIPKYFFNADSTDSEDEDLSASIDEDVARDMNLHGKTSLEYSDDDVPADDCLATESESSDDEDDDGADLADFVVDDDEDDEIELKSGSDDDSEEENINESANNEPKKERIRILRPASDTEDELENNGTENPEKDIADEEETRETLKNSFRGEKTSVKTPKKGKNLNESVVKHQFDLNESPKGAATHLNKNILLQSSTPKFESPGVGKLKNSKSETPLNKNADSSIKSEKKTAPVTKRLSKSITETVETPTKLHSSFTDKKTAKTPGTPQRLDTSLPIDISNSVDKMNLSKSKQKKISALHQTMLTPNSESPDTRFLMKEKLSDTLPPLKLEQRTKASRRSVLDNVTEDTNATIPENKSATESESVDPIQKKKKKKKTKSGKQSNVKEVSENETVSPVNASGRNFSEENSNECIEEDVAKAKRKAKKRNKKNSCEAMEIVEQMEVETIEEVPNKKKKKSKKTEIVEEEPIEIPIEISKQDKKKKKNKKNIEIIEEEQPVEISKTDKKKKKKKQQNEPVEIMKTDVLITKKKRSRDSAKDVATWDSKSAPESFGFTQACDEAIKNLKKVTESVKSGEDARKKKHQENTTKVRQNKNVKSQTETARSLKRLPDDLLESLSEVAERPKKRRKITWDQKGLPSKVTFSSTSTKSQNVEIDEGFIPLSTSGGTTNFAVVNLKKATKSSTKSKQNVAVKTFRERMLARNARQPISAYLMYQQKQRASGKDKAY